MSDDEITKWTGQERRGIPIHLLNYMDERLGSHVTDVKKIFTDHTTEEMERYKEILEAINAHQERTDGRYAELNRSIAAYMDRMDHMFEEVKGAFVTDKKGRPDFSGHAHAHEIMMEQSKEMDEVVKYAKAQIENDKEKKELYSYVRKVAVASAAVAIISWLTFVVWPAFLAGPR